MSPTLSARLAEVLARFDVDLMFGLPGGGQNLDLIGAAERHGIRFVLAHGETEAAIMASTHGLLTGRPTPVIVTRGPGVASLANGLAQATLDRYPLVAVADTVPQASAHRVAHQRLDQTGLLGPAAKMSTTISDRTSDADLAELVATACRWPYGGVHLDFDPTAEPAAPVGDGAERSGSAPAERLTAAGHRLASANRPVVIVGMEAAAWAARRSAGPERTDVGAKLASLGCPVLTTYQAIGTVPTEGPVNAGLFTNGSLERPVLEAADLVVTIGLDLVEPIPAPWRSEADVIRLSETRQLDDYLPTAIDLVGDLDTSVAALADAVAERSAAWGWEPEAGPAFVAEARARLRTESGHRPGRSFGPIELVDGLIGLLPGTATVTVDAGAHFLAVMPNWPVARPFELLISNGLATMGFAVPAAIGAALARPDEAVIALTGDGGLSMVLAELETIARLQLPITVVVFNDAALSLIEIKQGEGHGGDDAVRYRGVDYAAVAEASGVAGCVVTSSEELAAAIGPSGLDAAVGPRLVDARIDPAAYRHLIEMTRG
ncbi:MAG: thiamine pyrophosphate-binding protein [Acidimicrobiia bacterium]|nr:thiamine pyrophosphate-binding protein [Acidimicrobiia bacterium]